MLEITLYNENFEEVKLLVNKDVKNMDNFNKLQYARELARNNNIKYACDIYSVLINLK